MVIGAQFLKTIIMLKVFVPVDQKESSALDDIKIWYLGTILIKTAPPLLAMPK